MKFFIIIYYGDFSYFVVEEEFESVEKAKKFIEENYTAQTYKYIIVKEVMSYKLEGKLNLVEVS